MVVLSDREADILSWMLKITIQQALILAKFKDAKYEYEEISNLCFKIGLNINEL